MTSISHEKAHRFLHAAADGLLNTQLRGELEEHLLICAACRAYADELKTFESTLRYTFHTRWDRQRNLSKQFIPNIQGHSMRIFIHNRLTTGIRLLTGTAVVLVLVFALNYLIAQQLQIASRATAPVNTSNITTLGTNPAPQQETNRSRLIAFSSTESGNSEIYLIKTDGSGLLRLTDNTSYDGNPLWSPDGSRLAFESERDGNRNIYVLNLADGGITRLTHASGNNVLDPLSQVSWSPDGSRILFLNDQTGQWQSYTVTTDGSTVIRQIATAKLDGVSWSPDGSRIAYTTDNNRGSQGSPQIYVINADGSNRQSIPLPMSFFMLEGRIRWAKDGKSVFYQTSKCSSNGDGCGLPLSFLIYRASPGDGAPQKVASWNGQIVDYFIEGNSVNFIGTNRQPTIDSVDTWQWVYADGTTITKLAQWKNLESDCQSPDGHNYASLIGGDSVGNLLRKETLVFVNCEKDNQIWLYSVKSDGSALTKLNQQPFSGKVNIMEWSPDGQFLTFATNDLLGTSQFFTFATQTALKNPATRPVPLPIHDGRLQPAPFNTVVNSIPSTTTPQETTLPSILKDAHPGDLITFESNRDVNSDIFIIKKDGSGQINLTNNPADDINPLWSPDGSSIAFLSSRANIYYDLYVMRADGSQVKKLAPLGWLATWSPDGKQLAAYSPLDPQKAEKGRIDVIQSDGSALHSFPVDFSNTRVKQSFQLIMLHWTVDGKFIQFLIYEQPTVQNDISKDKWTIYQINLENGSLKRLLESKTRIEDWNGSDKAFTVLSLEENAWQWSRIEGQKRTTLATWQPEFGICSSHFGYFTATLTGKWSTDGKNLLLAAQCSDDATWLYLANADGTQITQLTNYPLSSFRGMSSDGKTITFSADLEVTGNLDIYLLNIQSALKDPATRPVRITRSGFSESAPDWQLKP